MTIRQLVQNSGDDGSQFGPAVVAAVSMLFSHLARLMSNVGLAIASLLALAAVSRLTKVGGVGVLTLDLVTQLWTVAILMAVAGPARTLGWRALLGAFLLGFLGLIGLARLVGRPVITALGATARLSARLRGSPRARRYWPGSLPQMM